jgi:esterase/lipase superfamily enzyme
MESFARSRPVHRTSHRIVLLIATGLVAMGCSRQVLMPTPTIVETAGVRAHVNVNDVFKTTEVKVYVAAPREVREASDPRRMYTNERARDIHLGRADVQIGEQLGWEGLLEASLVSKRKHQPEIDFVGYAPFGTLWASVPVPLPRLNVAWDPVDVSREPGDRWVADINAQLDASRNRKIFIFVHGFNTKFETNLGLAAEYWHFMARDGVMILYVWPSAGSVFAYQKDKANADYATRQFRQLLLYLAEYTTTDEISILAHSAGCPIVLESLRDLSLMNYGTPIEELRQKTKIGRVVLTAPDMDLGLAMDASYDGASLIPKTMVLYVSTTDSALSFSGGIFKGRRLGELAEDEFSDSERKAIRQSRNQAIDVTVAQKRFSSFLGHSYYHQNPWVSSDTMIVLLTGATPEERGLHRDDDGVYWTFPEDYDERLLGVVDALLDKYQP